ncbi:MAG: ribosome silencing factor [Coriobacteriia bacterium]|nr:ribosome silencing factor [Coriobacteriia bacterium]
MEALDIALEAAKAADRKKAYDIKILEVGKLSDSFDYFVIASVNNDRQADAVIDEVENKMRESYAVRPLAIEGRRVSQWKLIDFGSVMVHIFDEETRDFYRLEKLWGDAPQIAFEAELI